MHHMLAICRRKSSQKTIQKEGGKIVWKIVIRMSQQVKPGGKKKKQKNRKRTYYVVRTGCSRSPKLILIRVKEREKSNAVLLLQVWAC